MVSFIILNYKNFNDTVECIKSINKIDTQKGVSIIVVDNNTLEKKEITELKKYTNDIILLEDNLGYAKANNIGCKYAIDKYNPDFLIVSNNDIIVSDYKIIDKIYDEYKKNKFDMLGPKILTNGGESVNPFPAFKTKKEIQNDIAKNNQLIKIYSNSISSFLLNSYIKIKHFIKKPKKLCNGIKMSKGVPLHGCFIIFSKKYYHKYDNIFFNDTFLYHEEEFLYQRVLHNKLISIYSPLIEVYHKEGASLNLSFKEKENKKKLFKYNEKNKSLYLLLNYIEELENEKK